MIAGCSSSDSSSSSDTSEETAEEEEVEEEAAEEETEEAAEEETAEEETASSGSYEGQKIALVAKSAGNSFFEIAAAAKYLQDSGSSCKLTGLGLPSEMEAYTGDGDDYSCPYFYLWDMEGLGVLSAYTTMAMVAGEITGTAGETFTAGDLGEFTIEDNDGVSEIILGEPLEFNPDNVSEYAELY